MNKNLVILPLLFLSSGFFAGHIGIPCSLIRTFFLEIKNAFFTQKDKNSALYQAITKNDYCGTKFWLENGGDLKDSFGENYRETPDGTFLYVSIWSQFSPIRTLFFGYSGPKFSQKLLNFLKEYGIEDIKLHGPK